MENETELIRQQMTETRTALTEKLEHLEEQVTSRVNSTTESVAETVASVKEAVESTVHTVSDTVDHTVASVKETFNMSRQYKEHPWLFLGGAVALGFVAGKLLERSTPPAYSGANGYYPPDLTPRSYAPSRSAAYESAPAASAPSSTEHKSSWGGEAVEAMKPALSKLGQLAIGVTTGLIGEMVREAIPENLHHDVGEVLDDITLALGGKPFRMPANSTANQHADNEAVPTRSGF